MKRLASVLGVAAAVAVSGAPPVFGWGYSGHVFVSRLGAQSFPASLPAFVRAPAAVDEIAALGPELDRSKDAGKTHDADLDPGHYADIGDDATISGIPLTALPPNREAYDAALRANGLDEFKAGYLPYALIDGWQQVAKDFAIWRVDRVGEVKSATPEVRAKFGADRALRETLTIRDIGVWSHYVGDASQPLHVSIHFNGWGNYPNPEGFSTAHTVHAMFEGAFVREHATTDGVRAKMHAPEVSSDPIAATVGRYLSATASQVTPLYRIEKAGGFASASPDAVAFTDARLADGAAALRDLVTDAWNASATVPVGYPNSVTPADAESGAKVPGAELAGGTD